MGFLLPYMLFGLIGAAIPVLLHFFFRTRYQTVPWAAMKFLLTSVEQTSRRLKFQEYLLMLTRIAVLVFLAIALARPANLTVLGSFWLVGAVVISIIAATWALAPLWQVSESSSVNLGIYGVSQAGWLGVGAVAWLLFLFAIPSSVAERPRGAGDAIDVTFVFDTSLSMGARDGDKKTRLDKAKEQALALIDTLPAHSTVHVVTCAGKTKTLVGPHSPEQARRSVDAVELTHLGTDLSVGVAEAKIALSRGQSPSKELYVFSDMQKIGFEHRAGELKKVLTDIKDKEKAAIHFVRCGDRTIRNVAVVGVEPIGGTPRPGERVHFSVRIYNSGADPVDKLEVSLMVNGNEKTVEKQPVPKLYGKNTVSVTLTGKLDKPGLHVVTARVGPDDLDEDNRFDKVVLVRDQINILVVDGNPFEREPTKAVRASSYYLMHALQPVPDAERATYKFNPRVVPARLASAAMLTNQQVCILVNCAVQPKAGVSALHPDFLKALSSFVRNDGHGLIFVSGDHVVPDAYNAVFGNAHGLLPLALKSIVKAPKDAPFLINRASFGGGPPAFTTFKEDQLFRSFDLVEVWQHIELDERTTPAWHLAKKKDKQADADLAATFTHVIVRLDKGKALAATRKIGKGEVIFFGTSAHDEGVDPKTLDPNWTNLHQLPPLTMFVDTSINHLIDAHAQTHKFIAGQKVQWQPTKNVESNYDLLHPSRNKPRTALRETLSASANEIVVDNADALANEGVIYVGTELIHYSKKTGESGGKLTSIIRGFAGTRAFDWAKGTKVESAEVVRLGRPERSGNRFVLAGADLPRAGIYRLLASPSAIGKNSVSEPIAVTPDPTESEDLTPLTDAQINPLIGFAPIHLQAGNPRTAARAAELREDEAKIWPLFLVMVLVLGEVALAWWCGRSW
ncbi:MAG: BatA domain-containing protein [Planctomycetes bacterium]|nr:BatA domain-containing protein [Planctomycetota bacterium]